MCSRSVVYRPKPRTNGGQGGLKGPVFARTLINNGALKLIEEENAMRAPFGPSRPVIQAEPVDDQELLARVGAIKVVLSREFLREHVQLLSFPEEVLRRREVGG
jgi:hypothetical protein